jgi:hypothetical protein
VKILREVVENRYSNHFEGYGGGFSLTEPFWVSGCSGMLRIWRLYGDRWRTLNVSLGAGYWSKEVDVPYSLGVLKSIRGGKFLINL